MLLGISRNKEACIGINSKGSKQTNKKGCNSRLDDDKFIDTVHSVWIFNIISQL